MKKNNPMDEPPFEYSGFFNFTHPSNSLNLKNSQGPNTPYFIQKGGIYAIPVIHYKMEFAAQVRLAFLSIQPDCVAVELAETMELQLLHAASRLPDISIVVSNTKDETPLYYMCEPCDASFEALRSGLEAQIPTHCIDLDVDEYPDLKEYLPDPYAIQRIGLKNYYEIYKEIVCSKKINPKNPSEYNNENSQRSQLDKAREWHMAKRLKELSLRYEKVLFIGGMAHIDNVLSLIDESTFPITPHTNRDMIKLCTLTEESCRDVMAEYGWISSQYEELRSTFNLKYQESTPSAQTPSTQTPSLQTISAQTPNPQSTPQPDLPPTPFPPDRQKLIYQLYKESGKQYVQTTKLDFPGYHLRNLMKFLRNYALIHNELMPDLFKILTSAKGCVDHNYAYETWVLATEYPYRKNIDGLPELNLSIEEVWGHSKMIRFQLKAQNRKSFDFRRRHLKDRANFKFEPPSPFSICSFPPEDKVIENFSEFLRKKGTQILSDQSGRTIPFSTSIEDGIDTRETIRHWHEKKLYVKVSGKPPGGVGSVVVIFDPDSGEEGEPFKEQYPWKTTWLGEYEQESDMAFYATPMKKNVVGPGISRCEYGGFMMSYPPRRMMDVWHDPDYRECRNKSEILLMAAVDYAVQPIVVYVASQPPRRVFKRFAERFGKKIVYIPIGQLSSVTLNKLRIFHVLDGHDKRAIADEYI